MAKKTFVLDPAKLAQPCFVPPPQPPQQDIAVHAPALTEPQAPVVPPPPVLVTAKVIDINRENTGYSVLLNGDSFGGDALILGLQDAPIFNVDDNVNVTLTLVPIFPEGVRPGAPAPSKLIVKVTHLPMSADKTYSAVLEDPRLNDGQLSIKGLSTRPALLTGQQAVLTIAPIPTQTPSPDVKIKS